MSHNPESPPLRAARILRADSYHIVWSAESRPPVMISWRRGRRRRRSRRRRRRRSRGLRADKLTDR